MTLTWTLTFIMVNVVGIWGLWLIRKDRKDD